MSLDVQQFLRKEFPVDAVQVTAENMEAVAKWCQGHIHDAEPDDVLGERYVKVRVLNPLSERQTRAYVGDWVLYASKGYKSYTDKGFRRSFYPKQTNKVTAHAPDPKVAPHATGPSNVFQEPVNVHLPSGTSGNPGGTSHV